MRSPRRDGGSGYGGDPAVAYTAVRSRHHRRRRAVAEGGVVRRFAPRSPRDGSYPAEGGWRGIHGVPNDPCEILAAALQVAAKCLDMGGLNPQRVRDPLLVLLILAGLFFGLAPLLAPKQFADITGFAGQDLFLYRLAGAATLGYGVALLVGYRATWPELRIVVASTLVFNLGSLFAGAIAIAQGGAPWIVYVISLASILFVAGTALLLARPPVATGEPVRSTGPRDTATWIVALFAIGTLASLVFGLGPLILGGQFGKQLGYPGLDDFIYRQAGAATFGAAVGGALALMSQHWREIRLPAVAALTFNAASVFAALTEIAGGSPQPVAYVILAAAALVTVGMALALQRDGR